MSLEAIYWYDNKDILRHVLADLWIYPGLKCLMAGFKHFDKMMNCSEESLTLVCTPERLTRVANSPNKHQSRDHTSV